MSEGVSVQVTNVSPKVDESELKGLFECCGDVLHMKFDAAAGKCIITYSDMDQARSSVNLTNTPLGDQPIVVTLVDAAAKQTEQISRTIQIGNVPPSFSEEQLKAVFSNCGPIVDAKLAGEGVDALAFVEFASIDGAERAMNMARTTLSSGELKIARASVPISKAAIVHAAKKDLKEIMAKVRAKALHRSRSRDRRSSRSQDRYSRDRSSHRSSRDRFSRDRERGRSRSRSRRRRRSHSRSASRSRSASPSLQCFNCGRTGHVSRQCPDPPSRSRSPGTIKRKMGMPDRSGMIFNGYKWESIQNHSGITQTTGGRQPVQAVQLLQKALLEKQAKKIH